KNGLPTGATGTTYTTPLLKQSDNGAKIRAQVSIPGKVVLSDEATLTVTADTKPPTVVKVTGSFLFTDATVLYSEPVSDSGLDKANYSIDGGLSISAITRVSPSIVVLTTSKQTSG